MLVICLVIQAIFIYIVTTLLKKRIAIYVKNKAALMAHLTFVICAIFLLGSHLVQIYAWGLSLNISGIIHNLHEAMVFAGSSYTTVGFTGDSLPTGWQLMPVTMAVSGFFAFGWSASVLFVLSQALFSEKD